MRFITTILLALGTLIGNAQAVVKALDLSSPQGTSVWTCVQAQSFLKGIPRLYQEACGVYLPPSLPLPLPWTKSNKSSARRPHRPSLHNKLQSNPGLRHHKHRRLLLPVHGLLAQLQVSADASKRDSKLPQGKQYPGETFMAGLGTSEFGFPMQGLGLRCYAEYCAC